MKNKFSFDEHIKQALEKYEAKVPTYLWDQIDKKTDRRKPFFFWIPRNTFLVFLTAIILGGGIYNMLTPTRTFVISSAPTKFPSPQLSAEMKQKNRLFTSAPVSKSNHKNSRNAAIYAVDPGIDCSVEKQHATVKIDVQPDFIFSGKNKKTKGDATSLMKKVYPKTISPSALHFSDNESNAGKSTFAVPPIKTKSQLGFQSKPELIHVVKAYIPTVNSLKKRFNYIPCPTYNTKKGKQYFDFYSSYDFINRQFSDTTNSLYLEKRKEGNTISSAFSVGLRYTKLFNSGLNIRGGFNYSQINEKFSFTQGNIIQILYEINAAGDTIRTYQTESTRYKITHNRYITIDIPITIGYEKAMGDWSINANVGVLLNLISHYRGDILDKNFQPVAINSSQSENQYRLKNNIGIGYLGAVSIYYQLSDRIKLLSEPYFRYNVSPMNEFSGGFKQQYHTAGIKAGIRLDLQ